MIVSSVYRIVILLVTLLVGVSHGTEVATTTEAGSARAEINLPNHEVTSLINLVATGLLLGIAWIILIPILSGDVVLVNRRYDSAPQVDYVEDARRSVENLSSSASNLFQFWSGFKGDGIHDDLQAPTGGSEYQTNYDSGYGGYGNEGYDWSNYYQGEQDPASGRQMSVDRKLEIGPRQPRNGYIYYTPAPDTQVPETVKEPEVSMETELDWSKLYNVPYTNQVAREEGSSQARQFDISAETAGGTTYSLSRVLDNYLQQAGKAVQSFDPVNFAFDVFGITDDSCRKRTLCQIEQRISQNPALATITESISSYLDGFRNYDDALATGRANNVDCRTAFVAKDNCPKIFDEQSPKISQSPPPPPVREESSSWWKDLVPSRLNLKHFHMTLAHL